MKDLIILNVFILKIYIKIIINKAEKSITNCKSVFVEYMNRNRILKLLNIYVYSVAIYVIEIEFLKYAELTESGRNTKSKQTDH